MRPFLIAVLALQLTAVLFVVAVSAETISEPHPRLKDLLKTTLFVTAETDAKTPTATAEHIKDALAARYPSFLWTVVALLEFDETKIWTAARDPTCKSDMPPAQCESEGGTLSVVPQNSKIALVYVCFVPASEPSLESEPLLAGLQRSIEFEMRAKPDWYSHEDAFEVFLDGVDRRTVDEIGQTRGFLAWGNHAQETPPFGIASDGQMIVDRDMEYQPADGVTFELSVLLLPQQP